ncbi:HAD hydrolase-like protein [Methylobacterium trifolii]|uniref:Phosphoglycolate phosphatase n=1 Tax=Methylobacterium trifolii TaxID=1003092 RepID=A0ABQ4TVW6_9HYPH|nr:HAD hydrolase-like protein [Methylobacterium trifolii]GJE59416.1 Phosphoglycolate phosphatase [Methylobacterium trifolii]
MVLDFDGTLADSFGWFCGVLKGVADRYRFRRVEAVETDALRALGAREIMRRLGVPAWKLPFIARHMHGLAARDIATLRLFPGIDRMLADLCATGVPLALLSSNTEANVRQVLGSENSAYFTNFACGASVFGKARRLRGLLARQGIAPADALCIGDEIRDLEAARAVGCAFGAVAWGYTRADALAAAGSDFMFAHPRDIPPVLSRPAVR